MGGCEPPGLETLSLLPRLTLAEYRSKLCHASALIDDRLGPPPHLVEAVRETRLRRRRGRLAQRLVGRLGAPPRRRVPRLRRRAAQGDRPAPKSSPLLLLDRGGGEERPDTPSTTCSTSARPAATCTATAACAPPTRARWRSRPSASGPGKPPVRAVRLVDEPEVRADVRRALDAAGLVVAAVGYHARLPELAWEDGRRLEPAVSDTGLVVTPDAALVTAEGTVVPEILVSGLGAGLTADSGLACEPSYAGSLRRRTPLPERGRPDRPPFAARGPVVAGPGTGSGRD